MEKESDDRRNFMKRKTASPLSFLFSNLWRPTEEERGICCLFEKAKEERFDQLQKKAPPDRSNP